MTTRVVLYSRVSSRKQSDEAQLGALQAYAAREGWKVVETVSECHTGQQVLPELHRLCRDAKRDRFDAIVVASIDRLGRRTQRIIDAWYSFTNAGVDVHCLTPAIRPGDPSAELVVAVLAVIAEQEVRVRREAARRGQRNTRRKLGRPSMRQKVAAQVLALKEAGASYTEIAARTGVSRTTAHRLCRGESS